MLFLQQHASNRIQSIKLEMAITRKLPAMLLALALGLVLTVAIARASGGRMDFGDSSWPSDEDDDGEEDDDDDAFDFLSSTVRRSRQRV